MSTVLYRFDSVDEFPLLESYTTVRGSAVIRVEGRGDDAMLRVVVDPLENEPDDAAAVIALPLVAVDGLVERFELTVDGDASGCTLLLDAADACGSALTYTFGTVHFGGIRTCSVDAGRALSAQGGRHERSTAKITPPIHLCRLSIVLAPLSRGVDLGLVGLSVTGAIRLAPPGIA